MITNSPTFCPAPWTSLNIDQTGHVMPCMHSGYELGNIKQKSIQQILADKPLAELKQAMAQGQWHECCAWCQQLEQTTGSSGRTVRYVDLEVAAKINADIDWFGLEHITVNWSNLCNLTCVYCNPETSTAWQSVKKIPINHIKNEHQDLIELSKTYGKNIQGLTLGGGEPLLQKGLDQFLQNLDPTKVNVLVTTNLSVDLTNNTIYNILKTWPNVTWMISFDNADKQKFEYVRHGASWDQFESNILTMKRDGQNVKAHPAYSIYNALELVPYYEYCERHNLSLFWCELTHPWDLDARRFPKQLRDAAIAQIDCVLERWSNAGDLAVDTLIRYKKQLVDPSYVLEINTYKPSILKFHSDIEQQLNKSDRFANLWPDLAAGINNE